MEKTLKERVIEELEELRSDFGDEEVDNTLEVVNSLKDDFSDMGKWDEALITRLVQNNELLEEINSIREDSKFDDSCDF